MTMPQELYRAYNHVKEVIYKTNQSEHKLKLAKSELKESWNGITDQESDEGKFGFLQLDYPDQTVMNDRLSQFIQISYTSSKESMIRFIIEAYQLPLPRLILSIQTDYINSENPLKERFSIQEETKRAIQRGLTEAAKTANAWVMTSGVNHAMNRLVGEALCADDDVPCIGLCSWPRSLGHGQLESRVIDGTHSIQNSDKVFDLENECATDCVGRQRSSSWFSGKIRQVFKNRQASNPSHAAGTHTNSLYLMSNQQFPIYIHKYDQTNSIYNLEPNHSHFLLFDHIPSEWKIGITIRQDIEDSLDSILKSEMVGYDRWNKFGNDIPTVLLLLGGNITTLEALYYRKFRDRTPIVVVRGTGGLADIMADIAEFSNPSDKKVGLSPEEWKTHHESSCLKYKERLLRLSDGKEKYDKENSDDIENHGNNGRRDGEGDCLDNDDDAEERDDTENVEDDTEDGKGNATESDGNPHGHGYNTEKYIEELMRSHELIVVFDPIGGDGNLEDAIADAMLKRIYFLYQNYGISKYDSLAMELKWCLSWNQVDHARQNVFAEHVFENMTSSETMQGFVSTFYNLTESFPSTCMTERDFGVFEKLDQNLDAYSINIESVKCIRINQTELYRLEKQYELSLFWHN
ncbi:unnamed protein product [Rotaria socialis]|uniref:TRPM SLOG domain-containing protein n=2 Tax=Rotaria socialis TaxID=392032 RepID=A0A821FFL7_9BILA|nr:unnamed protein product [Rotaria socialis]